MKRKKILALAMAGFMAMSAVYAPQGVADNTVYADEVSDDFVIDENGVLTGYKGNGGDVVIPEGVTSIGDYAFEECYSLTSIKGYTGSYAETYAKDNGFEFVDLDEESTPSENPTPDDDRPMAVPMPAYPITSDTSIKGKAFYNVAGDDDSITLSDAQMILKYALKIAASDTQYTLADAQMCLKIALKIVSLTD